MAKVSPLEPARAALTSGGICGDEEMDSQIVTGKLMGIVEGPIMLLESKGGEKGYPVDIPLTFAWVQTHMEQSVTVLVRDGRVVEVQ